MAGNQSIQIKNFGLCLISRKKSNMLVKHLLQRTYPFVSSIHIGWTVLYINFMYFHIDYFHNVLLIMEL